MGTHSTQLTVSASSPEQKSRVNGRSPSIGMCDVNDLLISYDVKYAHVAGADPRNVMANPAYNPRIPSARMVCLAQSMSDVYVGVNMAAFCTCNLALHVSMGWSGIR